MQLNMMGGMGQKYKLVKTDVFGVYFTSIGNVSCHRAVCFRAISHVIGPYVFGPYMFSGLVSCFRAMSHVFGQCLMFSGNVSRHVARLDKTRIRMARIRKGG